MGKALPSPCFTYVLLVVCHGNRAKKIGGGRKDVPNIWGFREKINLTWYAKNMNNVNKERILFK